MRRPRIVHRRRRYTGGRRKLRHRPACSTSETRNQTHDVVRIAVEETHSLLLSQKWQEGAETTTNGRSNSRHDGRAETGSRSGASERTRERVRLWRRSGRRGAAARQTGEERNDRLRSTEHRQLVVVEVRHVLVKQTLRLALTDIADTARREVSSRLSALRLGKKPESFQLRINVRIVCFRHDVRGCITNGFGGLPNRQTLSNTLTTGAEI